MVIKDQNRLDHGDKYLSKTFEMQQVLQEMQDGDQYAIPVCTATKTDPVPRNFATQLSHTNSKVKGQVIENIIYY